MIRDGHLQGNQAIAGAGGNEGQAKGGAIYALDSLSNANGNDQGMQGNCLK